MELPLAFITGLLGGFGHCAGMCGPILAALLLKTGGRSISASASYHAGRIITYTAMGAAAGALGSTVTLFERAAHIQGAVLIFAGCVMVALGLWSAIGSGSLIPAIERYNAPVLRAASKLMGLRGALVYFPMGLVMGLLPCGLSYGILIASGGSMDPVRGALLMLVFGMGTLPAMMLVGYAAGKVGSGARVSLMRVGAGVVAGLGALYVYRGILLYAQV